MQSALVRGPRAHCHAHTFSRAASTLSQQVRGAPPPVEPHPHKATHKLCTGIVLNRAPILTAWGTKFERAYWKYQARLARALSNPFPYDFYFPPGSLHELRFRQDELRRDAMSFGKEYIVRERIESAKARQNKLLLALEAEAQEATPELKPVSRVHPADESGDLTDLNRAGDRNLYLVLRETDRLTGKGKWRLPFGDVKRDERLHDAAKRNLQISAGPDMDVWFVTPKPIGFADDTRQSDKRQSDKKNLTHNKIFFLKAHILAGQAKPSASNVSFAWLTKQEIQYRVELSRPAYWAAIKDMLSDQ
ncbi:hypothetical protein BKA62DRAFT_684442 [Auriculariales sp. MPI-PUGE-AT-0066]|nr:hypothetical protein BKA62DRAFT_684442 [Auriculariales sp. MPI-PUGE-AT-0066]